MQNELRKPHYSEHTNKLKELNEFKENKEGRKGRKEGGRHGGRKRERGRRGGSNIHVPTKIVQPQYLPMVLPDHQTLSGILVIKQESQESSAYLVILKQF